MIYYSQHQTPKIRRKYVSGENKENTGNADVCNAPSRPDANANAKHPRKKKSHVNPQLASLAQKETNEKPSHAKSESTEKSNQTATQRKLSHKFSISTPKHCIEYHTHSHSQNTHHRATRSARTSPRHVPRSPILITVSHTLPSAGASVTEQPFGSGELII